MLAITSSAAAMIVSIAAHCSPAPGVVRLTFVGGTSAAVASAALTEASRVWAAYGVAVKRAGDGVDAGVLVRVRMVDEAADAAPDGVALGSIEFHDGSPDPDVVLYPSRAWRVICQTVGAEAAGWPSSYREGVVARVLGRALAHELGHFLLQSPKHSQAGLMRAAPPIRDLMSDDRSLLALDAGARLRLRNNCGSSDISPEQRNPLQEQMHEESRSDGRPSDSSGRDARRTGQDDARLPQAGRADGHGRHVHRLS